MRFLCLHEHVVTIIISNSWQVAYAAKDLRCDTIVDIATLTGAQGIATGKMPIFSGLVVLICSKIQL